MSRGYERAFRAAIRVVRRVRPDRWPLVGPLVERVGDRVLRSTHPPVLTVGDHELRLDPNDDLRLSRGLQYEPLIESAMREHLPEGGVFVDAGAHIGFHTLLGARLVGPAGRVFAFEPAPATFALLTDNVERNGYRNVTLVNAALSDRSGTARLHLSEANSGDHRLADSAEPRGSVAVEVHGLDDFLPDDVEVDFVKLDVQGAEAAVLRGMAATLARSPDVSVVIEFAPFALPASTSPRELLTAIFERFEEVYDLDEPRMSVVPATPDALLASYTPDSERFTNLLCRRPRAVAALA